MNIASPGNLQTRRVFVCFFAALVATIQNKAMDEMR